MPHTSRHHTQSIIIITAAAATSTTSLLRRRRFEVSPAPPCPHFLTFPRPLAHQQRCGTELGACHVGESRTDPCMCTLAGHLCSPALQSCPSAVPLHPGMVCPPTSPALQSCVASLQSLAFLSLSSHSVLQSRFLQLRFLQFRCCTAVSSARQSRFAVSSAVPIAVPICKSRFAVPLWL